MKNIVLVLTMLFVICSSKAQNIDTTKAVDSTSFISIITVFNETEMACKDGYRIEEYIVEIDFAKAKSIHGKKIKITGKYNVVKGLENQPVEYDKNGNVIYSQGRQKDSQHIVSPVIEIIE